MVSKFYNIPGSHRPTHTTTSTEASSLFSGRRQSETYFCYQATPRSRKVSSRYDLTNPYRGKLGTYNGVFVPTALNVLSILMFLRFGFILGQLGIICTLALLLLSYTINLLTTLSISAISTNGTIRGGGAYYMISRCLGPEFGGSIGLVFFLGQVFNSGMNAVGIVEPILYNLGARGNNMGENDGVLLSLLPRGEWFEFTYATIILFICLAVAVVGSQTVSKAGSILFFVLFASIISIPVSTFTRQAFNDGYIDYTGLSWQTFKGNLYPHFTEGAAGSLLSGKESFYSLFGVFFPATAGIFAGAGMSSELRKPSKSIPKGTLWGLLFTFLCYAVVVVFMAGAIPRESLHKEVQILQFVSSAQWLIFLGELSTSIFSIIVGMVGAAYVLEAIAKDSILPGLGVFGKHPLISLLLTWFLTQLCLFSDVNKIASLITMAFLVTFIVMNLACFLLEIAAAPNFRPSFKYFDRYTALAGSLLSVTAMVIVDGSTASALIFGMAILFLIIHYLCPPKSWGDVSQSLIYHQVRKYLLRLRQDNIKYWRPQILLFVDNPRTSWNLIKFCNNLKKGGLYILGHVAVIPDFQNQYNEVKKQQSAWTKIRDMANIKAFVQVGTGPSISWGIRNVFLGSGLGGMKPNITVIGFFDLRAEHVDNQLSAHHSSSANNISINIPDHASDLPTDSCRNDKKIDVCQWVQILEDLSLMQSNIAVAHGFKNLVLPTKDSIKDSSQKRIIDLYPIQMCATMNTNNEYPAMISSNFDTYTLMLQFGAILVTVPEWKSTHILRVILFVEKDSDRAAEIERMSKLLQILRIEASLVVVSLDQFRVYNTIVKGDPISFNYVSNKLKDSKWWTELTEARRTLKPRRRFSVIRPVPVKPNEMKPKKYDTSKLQRMGVSFKMSSTAPTEMLNTPAISDPSSDEDVSLNESQLSIKQVAAKLDKLKNKHNSINSIKTKRPQPDKLTSNFLKPVFSSNALPNTKVLEDGTGDKPTIVPIIEDGVESISSRNPIVPELSPCNSEGSLIDAMHNIEFDDLPSRAQHLILNDMMVQLSRESALIFSTLPIPPLGSHLNEEDSLEYVQSLDMWLEKLPPTMLINSQTMTVTTAL